MTKKLSSLFIIFLSMMAMTSCLGTSEDNTIYYDDTAITAFSLGTLNITRHVKTKDGLRDSSIKSTYKADSYHFNIDQINHLNYKQKQWYDSIYVEGCEWKRQCCIL